MKTHKDLIGKIATFENIWLAHQKARKGKRSKKSVVLFEMKLEDNLLKIKEELASLSYIPSPYTTFLIYDPKERLISATAYKDRVIHHAICNIIEPIFERSFIFDTYANRKGKGTYAAIKRFQKFMKKNEYVLKCDIRKYFASINHQKLKEIIRRKIKCRATLVLIDKIIDSGNPNGKGLPIGNLTSQFFANVYLNELDHFVKNKLRVPYIRYVDDFVLLSNNKAELDSAKIEIINFLEAYQLKIHPHKSHIIPSREGVNFLGQRVYSTHRKLLSRNVRSYYKKLATNIKRWKANKIELEKIETSLNSWRGHAKQANTKILQTHITQMCKDKGLPFFKMDSHAWRFVEQ